MVRFFQVFRGIVTEVDNIKFENDRKPEKSNCIDAGSSVRKMICLHPLPAKIDSYLFRWSLTTMNEHHHSDTHVVITEVF